MSGDPHAAYVQQLAEIAADHFGVEVDEVLGDGRAPQFSIPRQIIMAKCREQGWSLPQIGRRLHRDHSTVSTSEKRIARLRTADEEIDLLFVSLPPFSPKTEQDVGISYSHLRRALLMAEKAANDLQAAVGLAKRAAETLRRIEEQMVE